MRSRQKLLYFCVLFFTIYVSIIYVNHMSISTSNQRRALMTNNPIEVMGTTDGESVSSTNKPGPPFTAVVIVTYMRSGSSLTGDILQQSQGSFYLYEPLRLLAHLIQDKPEAPLIFVNGTIRNFPINYDEEAVNIIRNWVLCDVSKLPESSLLDSFLGKGISNRHFKSCYVERFRTSRNKSESIDACIYRLKSDCERSPIRIIKTIRLSLQLISHLMDEIPGLKILHLVRDPRATLRSQMSFGRCLGKFGGKYGCANNYCTRLEDDTKEAEKLSRKHTGRVTTVLFEDIAAKPVETAKKLFDFIGTTFTRNAEEYIFNITSAGKEKNCNICTTRSNSSYYIDRWKAKMSPVFLEIIQERCKNMLQHYKYPFVTL